MGVRTRTTQGNAASMCTGQGGGGITYYLVPHIDVAEKDTIVWVWGIMGGEPLSVGPREGGYQGKSPHARDKVSGSFVCEWLLN
jgi:hypothetical protein